MVAGLGIMAFSTACLLVCLVPTSTRADGGHAPPPTSLAYLSVALVLCFVVGFATGPGSIPWLVGCSTWPEIRVAIQLTKKIPSKNLPKVLPKILLNSCSKSTG